MIFALIVLAYVALAALFTFTKWGEQDHVDADFDAALIALREELAA